MDGTEAITEKAFGTQLAQTVSVLSVHPRGTSDAEIAFSRFPTSGARGSSLGRGAVRDEFPDLPVDPFLVADVVWWSASELLVELVLWLAHRSALLAYVSVHALHLAISKPRNIQALCRDHSHCSPVVITGC